MAPAVVEGQAQGPPPGARLGDERPEAGGLGVEGVDPGGHEGGDGEGQGDHRDQEPPSPAGQRPGAEERRGQERGEDQVPGAHVPLEAEGHGADEVRGEEPQGEELEAPAVDEAHPAPPGAVVLGHRPRGLERQEHREEAEEREPQDVGDEAREGVEEVAPEAVEALGEGVPLDPAHHVEAPEHGQVQGRGDGRRRSGHHRGDPVGGERRHRGEGPQAPPVQAVGHPQHPQGAQEQEHALAVGEVDGHGEPRRRQRPPARALPRRPGEEPLHGRQGEEPQGDRDQEAGEAHEQVGGEDQGHREHRQAPVAAEGVEDVGGPQRHPQGVGREHHLGRHRDGQDQPQEHRGQVEAPVRQGPEGQVVGVAEAPGRVAEVADHRGQGQVLREVEQRQEGAAPEGHHAGQKERRGHRHRGPLPQGRPRRRPHRPELRRRHLRRQRRHPTPRGRHQPRPPVTTTSPWRRAPRPGPPPSPRTSPGRPRAPGPRRCRRGRGRWRPRRTR